MSVICINIDEKEKVHFIVNCGKNGEDHMEVLAEFVREYNSKIKEDEYARKG